jgi:hypothetical protein
MLMPPILAHRLNAPWTLPKREQGRPRTCAEQLVQGKENFFFIFISPFFFF